LLEDVDSINEKLGMLKDLGIKISLDDFGTGYSSLSELRELNIDVVKIDKKFIDRIIDDPKESLIIPEIISMAHKIGLSVVAEGVETESQKEYLKDAGCDIIQGYLIGAPLSREEAGERVAKGSLHR
jgi:EAL domain-containing protein (putative c-di-GMP-specific phosphodiesterase class I)